MNTNFEVVSITDNDDGTARVVLEMDIETLKVFAAIGLMEVFRKKAMEELDGHSDAEGTADPASGEGGGSDLWG